MLYHSIKSDIFVSLKCFYGCGLSPHFLFTKLDQGETFIRGVTQYLVLKWFTTHLTSKECSECIHRSAFVNIYCSRWTLLPDSECTDAVFHLQTKAHVCALWRHAAWPEGPFRRMTKQAWVLHEAQNGDLAFVPWLQTPFSPLLHFFLLFGPVFIFLVSSFSSSLFAWYSWSPLSQHSFVSGWKVEWACVSPKGADEGMTSARWRGLRGWGQLFGLSQNEGYCARYPRWFEGSTTGKMCP